MNKLIPVISEDEKKGMILYFTAYEKYAEEFTEKAFENLKDHPVLGKLIRDTPDENKKANRKNEMQLQKNAIFENKWIPYIEFQIKQGIAFAKLGLDFKSWFEVLSLLRGFIVPRMYNDFENSSDFLDALNGMNLFMEIEMGIIGEAYMCQKEEIIQEDREKIKKLNDELEHKVVTRTADLEAINKELDAFTYTVSHDLRIPLRAVNGYAEILNEDYGTNLDAEGKRIIQSIRYNTSRMGMLIDDLLSFSKLGKKEIKNYKIDMNELTQGVLNEINSLIAHNAVIKVGKLHNVTGDYSLMHQVMFNLISNAVKYSSKNANPWVEIESEEKDTEIVFSIKDNGVGFDMRYVDKLYGVFQRLHSQEEFDGTGVGLAIVNRIINKHKGRVWAEGKLNEGATFCFSLTKNSK